MDTQDLKNRAMAAYFRTAAKLGGAVMQPSPPEEIEVNGLKYIVLSNTNGILAVYRVRIVNDQPVLKGLKRWPKDLDATFAETDIPIVDDYMELEKFQNGEISTLELGRRVNAMEAALKANKALTKELKAAVRSMGK